MQTKKIPILLILISAFWSINSTCKNSQSGGQDTELKWEVVASGAYGGVERSENRLITEDASWTSLWEELGKNRFPAPQKPAVDFTQKYLVACFMGMRTSGGHAIEIKSMSPSGQTLEVTVLQESPGKSCMVTDAITHPYVIAAFDKGNINEANFVVETRIQNCDQ